jgi:hypothetical protein
MVKYLIIFGAGASYGSDTIGTPPLGADLYNELARFNPDGWGKLPQDQSDLFRQDFENGMKNLSQRNPHALPPLQRAMAAFFFNYRPKNTNLYYLLAQKINTVNWNGALVTLNYERLLELSLIAAGIEPCIGNNPNSQRKHIELCLPHGCCHLFCESVRGAANNISFAGMNITTNGPIKVIGDADEFRQRITTDAFPPVMSYFEPSKKTTSGANFIDSQRNRFSELVDQSEIIAIIGLRVRPHDGHIWEPLVSTKGKLIYCSGPSSREEFKSWKEEKRKDKNDLILSSYFRDCFDEICLHLNIKQNLMRDFS